MVQLITNEAAAYYSTHLTCYEGRLGKVVVNGNMVPESSEGVIALDYLGTEREMIIATGTRPLVAMRC